MRHRERRIKKEIEDSRIRFANVKTSLEEWRALYFAQWIYSTRKAEAKSAHICYDQVNELIEKSISILNRTEALLKLFEITEKDLRKKEKK